MGPISNKASIQYNTVWLYRKCLEKRIEETRAVLWFMIHVIMGYSANIPLDLLI